LEIGFKETGKGDLETMDSFGDLREWDRVLEQLAIMKETKTLDLYQSGLARILRYRKNWRLLEQVLEYGKCINEPTDEILEEIFWIVSNPDVYPAARIQAIKTLEYLFLKSSPNGLTGKSLMRIFDKVKNSNLSGPPIFQEAMFAALEKIRESSVPNPQAY